MGIIIGNTKGMRKKITFFLHEGGFVLRIQQKFNKDNCILGAIWGQNPAPKCEIGDIFAFCRRFLLFQERNMYFCRVMVDIARNILSFTGTFLTISCGIMLILQYAQKLMLNRGITIKYADYGIIIIGILTAIILIPYYYFPV